MCAPNVNGVPSSAYCANPLITPVDDAPCTGGSVATVCDCKMRGVLFEFLDAFFSTYFVA